MNIKVEKINNENIILVDGKTFDWSMSKEDLTEALSFSRNDPALKAQIIKDIRKHFVDSFSEFVGKEVSAIEINLAIESGSLK